MRRYLPLIVILLLATGLRFYRIDAQSFWNDEGNSARLSERSVELIIEGTASDVHPPLYYLILRGWRELVGDSEFGLRSFSAFSGVILVALVVPLVRKPLPLDALTSHTTSRAAILAAFALAINPALIYYSQETRMYMLLPLLIIASTVVLGDGNTWTRPRQIGYVLLIALGLYTHYFFGIVLIIHGGVMALRYLHTKPTRRWLLLAFISLLLYLPWIPYMLDGLGGNRGSAQPILLFLFEAVVFLFSGPALHVAYGALLIVMYSLLFATYARRIDSFVWFGLTLFALIFLGATDSEFYKFLLFLVPITTIGFSGYWGIHASTIAAKAPRLHRNVSLLNLAFLVGIITLSSYFGLREIFFNPAFARDDYRGMAQQIERENHPNAAILLNAPNQWEVFTYYHAEGAPVYPIPRTRDYTETLAELETIASEHDRLYVLYWGDQQQDPDRWVESWLDANTFKAREEWRGDVRFVTYAVPSAMSDAMQTPTNHVFDDKIRLNGYTLNADQLQPNDVIQLTLFWEAIAPVGDRYKLFVHLIDGQNIVPIAQKDSEPQPLTTEWVAGTTFVSNVGVLVPADAIGEYRLSIGWYDALDPTRRMTIDTGADALPLTTIEIIP